MALHQFESMADGIPDRSKRPIRDVARRLERCCLTSEGGTLMGDAFNQPTALPMKLNQAFSHGRWQL